MVEYVRDGDSMLWLRDTRITFMAENIRMETGKAKAKVTLLEERRILEEDDIALDRREERIRLANAAHKQLNGSGPSYPADQMQHDLLLFCRGLWREWVGTATAKRTKGDAEPSEPPYLVRDWLLYDAGHILFAPPGLGKSWTALLLAVSVDAGCQGIWECDQGPVLYINLERSEESFSRRLGQVNAALGLDRERELLMFHERGKSLADVYDRAVRTIEQEGVILAVIDSLSRAGTGSLIKDETANKAMDLANALGSAWLFAAHSPRADDSHTFGSQMFDAAADITISLHSQDADAGSVAPRLGIALEMAKANDVPKTPRHIWTYTFDRRYGLTSVDRAHPGEWPALEDDAKASPQDRVEKLLRGGEMYVSQIAEALGEHQGTVSRWLADMELHGKVRVREDGKRKYYGLPSWR